MMTSPAADLAADDPATISTIPTVLCPHCGTRMGLSVIAPAPNTSGSRLLYSCACGFGYPSDLGFARQRL